jgi:hypothetical protein
MEEFSCFVWMALNNIPQLGIVKLSLKFLINKGVSIYDVKCFDKFCQSEEISGRSQR